MLLDDAFDELRVTLPYAASTRPAPRAAPRRREAIAFAWGDLSGMTDEPFMLVGATGADV